MSGFPVTGVPGVPGGYATLSSTGSVLSAIPSGSVALGLNSATGPDTSGTLTAIGVQAGQFNTTGNGNTFVGYTAGNDNITGNGLTYVGYQAGAAGTTRLSYNTAVGYQSIQDPGAGASQNTAVGALTMSALGSTATANACVGYASLTLNTGGYNSCLGCLSGYAITSGLGNICIGYGAGVQAAGNSTWSTVSGNYNIWIGNTSGPGSAGDPSYCVAIGSNATCLLAGGVAIGVDNTGAGAAATLQDQIMLGTANHTVYEYQTNTSLGATYSNPTLTNSTVGAQINATKDTMLYLEVTTVFVLLVISMGPASTPTNAIFTAAACPVGTLITLRVPGGWYVATSYTSGAFHQAAVTC